MAWNGRGQMLDALWIKILFLNLLVGSSWTARTGPYKVAVPDYSIYHTKEQVFQAFRQTVERCPSFMKVTELTEGERDYHLTMPVVTVEPGGHTEDHSNKIRVLVDFGEHGRELISSEIGLRLLSALCEGGTELAALAGRAGVDAAQLQEVLGRTVLQIIPMENVRGREKVEAGDLCERKNGRGVDPNRNWDVHWGFKEPDYDPKEEYPGAHPFSEPEALLVRRVAEEFKPHAWVNVHSGMEALFMPYDHQAKIPDNAAANVTLSILNTLNTQVCGGRCAVGSGGKSVGYLAHGTATDYMYDKLNVPISMTWEVYGDLQAPYHDCFRMFNPLSPEAYSTTVETWAAGVLALVSLLPRHPDIPQPLTAADEGINSSMRQPQQAQQQTGVGEAALAAGGGGEAVGEGMGGHSEVALGGKGSVEEGQQQGREKAASGGSGKGAAEAAAKDSDGSRHQERAGEIAAALLGTHPDQQRRGAQQQQGMGGAAAASLTRSIGGPRRWVAAAKAAQLQRGWGHPHVPGTRADWEAVCLFLAVAGLIVGGYLAYTKPRVRYTLSRWGFITRRTDIPL